MFIRFLFSVFMIASLSDVHKFKVVFNIFSLVVHSYSLLFSFFLFDTTYLVLLILIYILSLNLVST